MPPGFVHPMAVDAMQELGIDLSENSSNQVDEFGQSFELVVTVCDSAKEVCPVCRGAMKMLHWPSANPASDASM